MFMFLYVYIYNVPVCVYVIVTLASVVSCLLGMVFGERKTLQVGCSPNGSTGGTPRDVILTVS